MQRCLECRESMEQKCVESFWISQKLKPISAEKFSTAQNEPCQENTEILFTHNLWNTAFSHNAQG